MSIKPDKWIRRMAQEHGMIEPFVERQVRNLLWKDKSQAEFYRGMEWLYGWKEDNCLLPR